MDVFAYGMILYELLSQSIPYYDIKEQEKVNESVVKGIRPTLLEKQTRTPIYFQELMILCWSQEPDNRPTMSQSVKWIQTPQFERLRAHNPLEQCKSILCSFLCRVLPEYEENEKLHVVTSQFLTNSVTSLGSVSINAVRDATTRRGSLLDAINATPRRESLLNSMDPTIRRESLLNSVDLTSRRESLLDSKSSNLEIKEEDIMENPFTLMWICGKPNQIFVKLYVDGVPDDYGVSSVNITELVCIVFSLS